MPIESNTPLTQGEARLWARRLRKIGFSPVTVQCDLIRSEVLQAECWYLRCNWPYDVADMPPDLYEYLTGYDEPYTEVMPVTTCAAARALLAKFHKVRRGMGSRPLTPVDSASWEPKFITAGRIMADYDDWPLMGYRPPDYLPDLKFGF